MGKQQAAIFPSAEAAALKTSSTIFQIMTTMSRVEVFTPQQQQQPQQQHHHQHFKLLLLLKVAVKVSECIRFISASTFKWLTCEQTVSNGWNRFI